MSIYLFILFLITFAAITAILFKGRFEQALPCCICYVILIIYISGLISNFLPGFLIVLLTVPVAGILCLIWKRKTLWKELCTYVFTPGFFFFTIAICLMLPWTMKMKINSWDEFSHWCTVIKNFWYLNDFANLENSTTHFKGYPPAASIFAWFAQRFGKNYVECKSYLAYHALYLAWMSPYFCVITKKNEWWKAVLMGLCVIQLPTICWYRTYDVTYVDSLLGIQTALLFIVYTLYKDTRWRNVTICLTAMVTCLTKASGVGLCIIASLTILIAEIMRIRQEGKSIRNAFNLPAIMCASIILGKYSWDIYLKVSNTSAAWNTSNITLANIWELLSGNAPAYRYQTIQNFFKTFATMPMAGNGIISPSCLAWVILILIVGIYFYFGREKNTKKLISLGGVICGFPVYAMTLLLLYLFTYSESEALALASFGRYMGTWLACGCAVVLIFLFDCPPKKAKLNMGIIILMVILCGYLPTYSAIVTATPITFNQYKDYPIDYRFQNVKETLDEYHRDDIKVFFVHQQDPGYWYQVCRYGLTPYQIQASSSRYSFDTGYSSDKWAEELINDGYSHVFLNAYDEIFIHNFEDMFENSLDINYSTLYEIRYNENGIKLHKIKEYW